MCSAAVSRRAVELAHERWGRLDAVVLNHGMLEPVARVSDASVDKWRKGFEVNVFSAVELVRLLSKYPFFSVYRY